MYKSHSNPQWICMQLLKQIFLQVQVLPLQPYFHQQRYLLLEVLFLSAIYLSFPYIYYVNVRWTLLLNTRFHSVSYPGNKTWNVDQLFLNSIIYSIDRLLKQNYHESSDARCISACNSLTKCSKLPAKSRLNPGFSHFIC